jgi:hypothetical protein
MTTSISQSAKPRTQLSGGTRERKQKPQVNLRAITALDERAGTLIEDAQKNGAAYNFSTTGTAPKPGQCPIDWAIRVVEENMGAMSSTLNLSAQQPNQPAHASVVPLQAATNQGPQDAGSVINGAYEAAVASHISEYLRDPVRFRRKHSRTQDGLSLIENVEAEIKQSKERIQAEHAAALAGAQAAVARSLMSLTQPNHH